jgi:glutamyl-tRNA synthetase
MLAAVSFESSDGRYAPSPSGPLHLGNLRTALLAWCFARSAAARFLLRIEDLDRQRSRASHEAAIIADLRAIGVDWDGPPAHQSDELERHREAFEQLRASGRVYPCWCTRAEVRQALAAPHPAAAGSGEAPYPGSCRELSARERSRRRREGSAPLCWRLDAGAQRVRFVDRLRGEHETVVDDFVLWRGDPLTREHDGGAPAYNLAVVVDDAAQGVGEVVRGDDLLDTTPRQILLARLLGLVVPRYAHVPLVLGSDGRRLAKRHGAVTLAERLALGESVETVIGWMASSAGLVPAGRAMGAEQVLAAFDPARITREATVLGEPR